MKSKIKRPKIHEIRLTLNAAAKALNTDRRTMAKRLEAIGLVTGGDARFTIAEIFRAISGEYAAARTRVSKAMAERLERENRIKADELADKAEVRAWIRSFMALLFGELDRIWCQEAPPTLKGLSEAEIAAKCQTAIDELKSTLRRKFEEQLADTK